MSKINIQDSDIIKAAKRIKTNPSVNIVKSLKFNKKTDYTKFVKWIGSSVEKIEDIELPEKKKIKAINVTGSGGGGIGLGTLLLGGLVALPVLRKLINDFSPGGIKFDNIFGQGSGFKSEIDKWSNVALGVGITGWSIVALRNPAARAFLTKLLPKKLRVGSLFAPKAANNIVKFRRGAQLTKAGSLSKLTKVGRMPLISAALDFATGTPADEAIVGGLGFWKGAALGGKLGLLGGPAVKITVPLGMIIGGLIGEEALKGVYKTLFKGESTNSERNVMPVSMEKSFATVNRLRIVVNEFRDLANININELYPSAKRRDIAAKVKTIAYDQAFNKVDIGDADPVVVKDRLDDREQWLIDKGLLIPGAQMLVGSSMKWKTLYGNPNLKWDMLNRVAKDWLLRNDPVFAEQLKSGKKASEVELIKPESKDNKAKEQKKVEVINEKKPELIDFKGENRIRDFNIALKKWESSNINPDNNQIIVMVPMGQSQSSQQGGQQVIPFPISSGNSSNVVVLGGSEKGETYTDLLLAKLGVAG